MCWAGSHLPCDIIDQIEIDGTGNDALQHKVKLFWVFATFIIFHTAPLLFDAAPGYSLRLRRLILILALLNFIRLLLTDRLEQPNGHYDEIKIQILFHSNTRQLAIAALVKLFLF